MTTLPDRLLAFRDAAESTNDDEGNEGCATYVPVSLQIFRDAMDEAAAALSGGEAEVERLRVQLAACGVLAMCNTRESLGAQQFKPGDYGWSSSLGEVIAAAEREIALREQLATTPQPGDGVVVPRWLLEQVYGMAREGCDAPTVAYRWCERIDGLFHGDESPEEYAEFAEALPVSFPAAPSAKGVANG